MDPHPPDVAGLIIRRAFGSAALTVCTLLACGCQLLSLAELEKPVQAVAIQPPTDLERLIAVGRFELDRSWTVWDSLSHADGDVTLETWRWKFVVPDSTEKLPGGAPAHSDLPADLADLKAKYGCLWHPRPDLSSDEWGKAVEELTTVSSTTGATGLKADILLGRLNLRNPHYGADFWKKLTNTNPGDSGLTLLAAAAEVYCRLCAGAPGDPEEAFAEVGRKLEQADFPEDLRGELFRGIARRIPPKLIPGLNDIMVANEAAKQMTPLHSAAVEACVIHAWHRHRTEKDSAYVAEHWPDGLRACRYSEDISLRKLYSRWIVLAHHPDAVALLKSQRLDLDLGVREEAVISLGLLDWETARGELLAVMEKGTDPERVAAVAGLSQGGNGELLRFARDKSAVVRAEVARQLAKFPSRSAAVTLAEMLTDQSPDVQLAALAAFDRAEWQNQGRMSLLLQTLKVGVLRTQISALASLRKEWGTEPEFPLNGTAAERESAVRRLSLEHEVSTEVFTAFASKQEVPEKSQVPDGSLSPDDVRRMIREFLSSQSATSDDLSQLDAACVPIIEQELHHAAGPRAEDVYRDVLPKWHAGYAALVSLRAQDPVFRREAARELRLTAERGSLSPALLARLSKLMTTEQDRQVWQEILTAIQPESVPEAARIALIALNSTWPDLRSLGCGYFELHPQPEFAAWLLPRLQDTDRQVRLRTVQVLGACGNPAALDGYRDDEQSIGLRPLLASSDNELRWATVLAMSKLGDPQAAQELIRQSYDPHPRQREQAVVAMGETGQRRFLEHLLRRSWTESDRGVQAAILKSLELLVPPAERPGLAADAPIGDKIRSWAEWWERQRPAPVTAGRSELPVTEGSDGQPIPAGIAR